MNAVPASPRECHLPDAGMSCACSCMSGHVASSKAGLGSWQGQSTLGGEGDVLQRLKELQDREAAKAAGARMPSHMRSQLLPALLPSFGK